MNLSQINLRNKLVRLKAIARKNNNFGNFYLETKKVIEYLETIDVSNKDKIEDSLDKAYGANHPSQAVEFIDEAMKELR